MRVSKIFRTQTPCKHIPKKEEFNCSSQTHQLGKLLLLSWGEMNERLEGGQVCFANEYLSIWKEIQEEKILISFNI